MRIQLLPFLAVGILAWTALACPAQERELPPPNKLTEKPPPPKPAPLPPLEASPRPCHTVPKVLVYQRDIPVQILVEREGPLHTEEVPTLDIKTRKEKRKVTQLQLQPREVSRVVCYTALENCVVTDPCTGECSTVLKPVERTRIQKDVEFVSVPVETIVDVDVPFLIQTTETIERKTFFLEYRTVPQMQWFALSIPSEVLPPRTVVTPLLPACTTEGHP